MPEDEETPPAGRPVAPGRRERPLRLWNVEPGPDLSPAKTVSIAGASRPHGRRGKPGEPSGPRRSAGRGLNLDRAMMAIYGVAVLTGVALSQYLHPQFIWLAAAAGAGALVAALTGFSVIGRVLKAAGMKPGAALR